MKFLCPSCKAKYQIADEKVAGKSVRMKCRKCGYMIQVGKLAEAAALEGGAPPSDTPPPPSSKRGAVSPVATPTSAPRPAPSPSAPRAAAAPRASAPRAAPPPRHAAAPPRATPLATSPRAATPTPRPADVHAPIVPAHGSSVAQAAGRVAYADDDERTMIASAGALAGAFAAAVESAPVSTALEDLASASDDWYVGINGVPVGPIRLSEVRSKAAAGAVTADSLVWRDGFEEWLPLKTFPELVAIVEEGVSSAHASLAPPESISGAPTERGPGVGTEVLGHISDPFKPSTAVGAVTGPAVVTERQAASDLDIDALVPPRRGTSPAAWIAVIVALLFGLTIGFVAFNKEQAPKQIVKYVQVPASAAAAQQPAGDTKPSTGPEDDKTPEENKATHGGKIAMKGPAPKAGDPTPKSGGLTGLEGLSGLQGATGPKGPSSTAGSNGSSGEPLDGAKVQQTVARYTSSVRRSCWQPALDTRDKDASTSARVSVTIRVAPSGSVQSVSTSGDPKGYRGLAGCIGSKVRGWQFPASSGTTTVNVPFVFAAQ